MPIKTAISWSWATEWLRISLSPYLHYADEPQELKNWAEQKLTEEIEKITHLQTFIRAYSKLEKGLERTDVDNKMLKEYYKYKKLELLIQNTNEEEWDDLLNSIYPNLKQMSESRSEYNIDIIEPQIGITMEDVERQIEPPTKEVTEEVTEEFNRPIESMLVQHPKSGKPFAVGPGARIYNRNKKAIGTIRSIYEDRVVVEEEKTGQEHTWPLTDEFWESVK